MGAVPYLDPRSDTTCVLTSCGRYDLLKATIESFFTFNTYPIRRFIVVEDGAAIPQEIRNSIAYADLIEWIDTGERQGQITSIDYAYSRVKTSYIFHLEDDWEFYRSNFIQQSRRVLACNPKCLQVQIRALTDTMRHPVLPYTAVSMGVEWHRMSYGFDENWHGFAFNPGLRRLRDYVAIGGYGIHTCKLLLDKSNYAMPEETLNKVYRDRDFFTAILSGGGGRGFVRHIGWGRTVSPPSK